MEGLDIEDRVPIVPHDVYDEICCDWPLISGQEAAVLCTALPPATVFLPVAPFDWTPRHTQHYTTPDTMPCLAEG